MKKNHLLSLSTLFLFFFLSQTLSAITITWTGNGGNTRWSNSNNWDTGTVPGINDDVILPNNSGTVDFNFLNRSANSLRIGSNTQLNILNNRRLVLVNTTSVTQTLFNNGFLRVRGTLVVHSPNRKGIENNEIIENFGNISIVDCQLGALDNDGLMFNRLGAILKITDQSGDCINNDPAAEFVNEGFIYFSTNDQFSHIVRNSNVFFNTTAGNMVIDGTSGGPISCLDGTFTNQGDIEFEWNPNRGVAVSVSNGSFTNSNNAKLTIEGFTASAISTSSLIENAGTIEVSGNGISNSIRCLNLSANGVFTNQSTGYVEFSESTGGATLWSSNCRLNNFGTISIYETANGIVSSGVVLNRSGAVLKISDVNLGIHNLLTGFFGNIRGTVYCTGSNNVNFSNAGFVRNFSCSKMFLDGQIAHSNGTFMNQGWILNEEDGSDHIVANALISNTGIITDPYDRFVGALQNNKARIPALVNPQANVPYPNALDIANTVGLSITGLFLNSSLTNPAGTYNLATNTYTPNAAAIGATQLYARTAVGNSCVLVIPIRVDGGVLPIVGTEPAQSLSRKLVPIIPQGKIRAYPNPGNGNVNLELAGFIEGSFQVQLIDTNGRLLQNIQKADTQQVGLDFSNTTSGIYTILVLQNGMLIGQERLVIY